MIVEDEGAVTELERRITHGTELLLASITQGHQGFMPLAFDTLSKAIDIVDLVGVEEQDEELVSIAYHNRGIIRCLRLEQEESIEDFTHAIAWTISPASSRYAHAQALLCAGDIEQAHDDIAQVIKERHPSYLADAVYVRGFIRSETEDLNGAIRDLKSAIRLGISHVGVFATLAKCYALKGGWEMAAQLWTSISPSLENDDSGFLIVHNQGIIQMGLGIYEHALDTLQANPYKKGNERFVNVTIAGCLYRMGLKDQAGKKMRELDMQEDEIEFILSDELLVPVDMLHEDYRPRIFGDGRQFKGGQN
ncbi:MAG TPA: hypothetical protein VJH22_00990 [Candidatus Nanoarchaeia archaeon]|nr:hypothetical protein [Candidatus Nanoarchaeia archaeon]